MERKYTTKNHPLIGRHTDWGKIDLVSPVADGITEFYTSSHGGIKLDRSRNAQVHSAWRRKGGWYEEDVDACIVILTFPHIYVGYYDNACSVLKQYLPHEYQEATGLPVTLEESLVLREEKFKEDAQGQYVAKSVLCRDSFLLKGVQIPVGYLAILGQKDDNKNTNRWFQVPAMDYKPSKENNFNFIIDSTKYQTIQGLSLI